jgi:hypothetical protein
MTLRIPQGLPSQRRPDSGVNVLDYELAQLKAQTLGDLGRQVEQALERLRTFEAENHGPDAEERRAALRDAAADRAWALMIQRELCGLRHWDAVVKAYGIPREVLNRMGRVSR